MVSPWEELSKLPAVQDFCRTSHFSLSLGVRGTFERANLIRGKMSVTATRDSCSRAAGNGEVSRQHDARTGPLRCVEGEAKDARGLHKLSAASVGSLLCTLS